MASGFAVSVQWLSYEQHDQWICVQFLERAVDFNLFNSVHKSSGSPQTFVNQIPGTLSSDQLAASNVEFKKISTPSYAFFRDV